MQGKEQNFSTSDSDALHKSMQGMRVLKRCGLEKMVSNKLFVVRILIPMKKLRQAKVEIGGSEPR